MLGTTDVLMVGRYGGADLAATVLANAWISGAMIFLQGVVFGVDPIVGQAHGAGDGPRAGLALQRGIVVALLASVPLMALWALTGRAVAFSVDDAEVIELARRYGWAQVPSASLLLLFAAMRQYLQGRGILRPALVVTLVANLANVVLNWALVFGHLGLPPLGAVGAGIATSLVRLFMLVCLLWLFLRERLTAGAWTPWSRAAISPRGLWEVLRFGLPIGVQLGLEVWAFSAATLMAGRLGTLEAAAHGVVLNMASLSFMLPLGVSLAAVTRVGNLIGAGETERAQCSAWVAFGLGGTVMAACGALFLVLRHELPRLYTSEADVIAIAAVILPIAAAFQVFDGLQAVGSGILRGMGATVPAATFNLVGYWVLALPLAWWMTFERGLGLSGLWWGLAIALALIAACLMLWVWRRGPRHAKTIL